MGKFHKHDFELKKEKKLQENICIIKNYTKIKKICYLGIQIKTEQKVREYTGTKFKKLWSGPL